mmetsp:Transcript_20468/g.28362  ORF Transcript_20468/g.28362 Transcript_20468/m.28362 type:complete len:236 (-) Transcript_20468:151-858(-)
MLTLEFLNKVVHHPVVKVFATKMGVSSSCFHLENPFFDCEQRHIERTTTEIKDQDIPLSSRTLLVQSVCNRSSSWLVDDSHAVKARDGGCVLSSLSLGVVEISRDGNDRVLNLLGQVCLCNLLHFDKNHGRNLFCRELFLLTLVINLNHRFFSVTRQDSERPQFQIRLDAGIAVLASNESLGVKNCVAWVHRDLILSGITNETFCVSESNIGRCSSVTLVVGNDLNTVMLPDTNT